MQEEKKTVLVVDDEPMVLDLIRNILECAGYAVVTADSPVEALDVIRCYESSVDLLLTDIQMPEMNGIELARRLNDYRSNVAVAFMTGFVSGTELPTGAPVIRKPFRPADLVKRIGEVLEDHSARVRCLEHRSLSR